jgi:hypothetical protein
MDFFVQCTVQWLLNTSCATVLAETAWASGVHIVHPGNRRCLPPDQNPLKGEPQPPFFSANLREKSTDPDIGRVSLFVHECLTCVDNSLHAGSCSRVFGKAFASSTVTTRPILGVCDATGASSSDNGPGGLSNRGVAIQLGMTRE